MGTNSLMQPTCNFSKSAVVMKTTDKQPYITPSVDQLRLQRLMNFLVSMSAEAGFEEWEEGEEL